MREKYDLIVIGGGPAGYVGAIRAAQLGMRTMIIEKDRLGGTCLNVGCIPTKALFESAMAAETAKRAGLFGVDVEYRGINFAEISARKDRVVAGLAAGVKYLMKKNGVHVAAGSARLTGPGKVEDTETGAVYEGDRILIAAGSENALPPVPGFDGRNVLGSTELLRAPSLPRSLAVVGGGVIGCEFAGILRSFGVNVTIIELQPGILANMERECADYAEREFAARGVRLMTSTKVKAVEDGADGEKRLLCEADHGEEIVYADWVLTAVGRKARTSGLGLEALGIETDRGFIAVNDHMETSVPGIYAAGDVTGKSFLAHAAYAEGSVAVENMMGGNRRMNYRAVPSAVFVNTELGSVGLREQEARAMGYDVITGSAALSANGKALTMESSGGFVKVVSERKNHEILGIHMAGPAASELVTVGAGLIGMEALMEDVENAIYPHPSISEAIREACMAALGRGVHM